MRFKIYKANKNKINIMKISAKSAGFCFFGFGFWWFNHKNAMINNEGKKWVKSWKEIILIK